MPHVLIPPPYRGPTAGAATVEVTGETVRACIEAVDASHPGFATLVFDAAGEPHSFVKVFVNGEQSRADSTVGPDDEVEVLAAIGGG